MGYPLVPGYESVGRGSRRPAPALGAAVGERVFVPGARCFGEVRGLFGGAAARLVVPGRARRCRSTSSSGEQAVLLALAATARHAIAGGGAQLPDLIVGHGVLGRLLARLAVAAGGDARRSGSATRSARDGARRLRGRSIPTEDPRRDYRCIYDVSGDAGLLDTLIGRLAPGGEIVLAGFYSRAAVLRLPAGLHARGRHPHRRRMAARPISSPCSELVESGAPVARRPDHPPPRTRRTRPTAYRTAFGDPACLKMILDWRACA